MIEEYRKKNDDLMMEYQKNNNIALIEKHKLIKQILNDEACFFKMPIEDAFSILNNLGVNDTDIKIKYKELVSYNNFTKLENGNN